MATDSDDGGIDMSSVVEQWRYANEHPGFEGSVEFDLTFEMLGHRFTRRARADYRYTPEWEYWDLTKNAPRQALESSAIGFSIFVVPEDDMGDPPSEEDLADGYEPEEPDPPSWIKFDIAEDGLIPRDVWDEVYELVDRTCKEEDVVRRREAGAR